jgi:hypothetical protein
LQEGTRLSVNGSAQKIVSGGVADVELDGGIELDEFDEFGWAEGTLLGGRLGGERFAAKFLDGTDGFDAKDGCLLGEQAACDEKGEEETTKHGAQCNAVLIPHLPKAGRHGAPRG